MKNYNIESEVKNNIENEDILCEPVLSYSITSHNNIRQLGLFNDASQGVGENDIKVVELFAGVGGFRIGLERASSRFKTIWNNQWEPSTKRQDASIIYCKHFGEEGHSNEDISCVPTLEIPNCNLLCGGFPCQDYSVATTLQRSGGIDGKKGVLWWQIYRILDEKNEDRPEYLMLENVDRLINSPASQRGRDFAIILSSLSMLGYIVEWRIINAAEYGMPQRRRRIYIVAYHERTEIANHIRKLACKNDWITEEGVMSHAFLCRSKDGCFGAFRISENVAEVSEKFNKGCKASPFKNAGIMIDGNVHTLDVVPIYKGHFITLGDILVDNDNVPEEYFISKEDMDKWIYLKGAKTFKRVNKLNGFEYNYSEGAMAFPDSLDKPSRTIITGEGGASPSRFKHVILDKNGHYRRLVPIELERLNMFPDNYTSGVGNSRRAFLMGNALVTGIVENLGLALIERI